MKLYEEVDEQASPEGWIYLEDGEYYNLYSAVEDVVSDPVHVTDRELRWRKQLKKRVDETIPKPTGKIEWAPRTKPKEPNPIPNAIQVHSVRVTTTPKEIHMNMQERLAAGVENLRKVHDISGSVARVNVGHDEGCRFWDGGKCSCSPDITMEVDGVTYMINEKGDIFKWVLTDS